MEYSLRLISKAEDDITEVMNWYVNINRELAKDFLHDLDKSFRDLLIFPEAYPLVFRDMRMYVLKRFPYKVVYIVDGNEVVVHAVKHHKQHPAAWKHTR